MNLRALFVIADRNSMTQDVERNRKSNFSLRSALTFLVVGGFSTAVHYLIIAILVNFTEMKLVPASAIGFAVSAIGNYLLNASMTFRSNQSHKDTAPRFLVVSCSGLLINTLLLSIMVFAGLLPVIAQPLTTIGVMIWNYSINGLWTFKARPR